MGAQRKLQIALGLIWLMDGALQLQPFMFGRAFVTQIIAPNETGQPGFVAAPIRLIAHLVEPRVALFNLFAVAIQVLIGFGLIYRPTVKPALLASFGWALGIWWIGEGLGGLFTGTASPLTGAPGAALLYVLAGLIAWPQGRWQTGRTAPGGLLGERGARTVWALLWLGSAALWLLPANRTDTAVHDAIANAPSGTRWLSSIHSTLAAATTGHGTAIAVGAASLSAAVGVNGTPRPLRQSGRGPLHSDRTRLPRHRSRHRRNTHRTRNRPRHRTAHHPARDLDLPATPSHPCHPTCDEVLTHPEMVLT